MIRYLILHGDKTTANGTVFASQDSRACNRGRAIAMLGDSVYCRTCDSTGQIIGQGPRRAMYFMGREPALDRDLCGCKCRPYPKLINSRVDMSQSMTTDEVIAQGFGAWVNGVKDSQDSAFAEADELEQYFEFIDDSGAPVNLVYRLDTDEGKLYEGMLDDNGLTISVSIEKKLIFTSWTQHA